MDVRAIWLKNENCRFIYILDPILIYFLLLTFFYENQKYKRQNN